MENEILFNYFDEQADKFDDEADTFLGIGRKAKKRKAARKARFNSSLKMQIREKLGNKGTAQSILEVEENLPQIQSYMAKVAPDVVVPNSAPQAAAAVAGWHEQRILNRQAEQPTFTDQQAEEDIIADDIEQYGEEADNFLGGILGSVLNAGKAFVTKVNEKRTAKGKKPLFAGKNWKKLKDKVNANETAFIKAGEAANEAIAALKKDNPTANVSELKAGFTAAAEQVTTDAKKAEFKKMLPLIIGAVVVIILVTLMFRRK